MNGSDNSDSEWVIDVAQLHVLELCLWSNFIFLIAKISRSSPIIQLGYFSFYLLFSAKEVQVKFCKLWTGSFIKVSCYNLFLLLYMYAFL